jgi:formylglycine-generating enzyme required for sulfatase activity
MYEWVLDWTADYVNPCTDCAQFLVNPGDTARVIRGGSFATDSTMLYAASRGPKGQPAHDSDSGLRCARRP